MRYDALQFDSRTNACGGPACLESELYAELRARAQSILRGFPPGSTLSATALVHESVVRLVNAEFEAWDDRRRLVGTMVVTMRRIMVDAARRRAVRQRVLQNVTSGIEQSMRVQDQRSSESHRVLAVESAMDGLREIDQRAHAIVELKFFALLNDRDIANQLGLSPRTVRRDWAFAKAWLLAEIAGD